MTTNFCPGFAQLLVYFRYPAITNKSKLITQLMCLLHVCTKLPDSFTITVSHRKYTQSYSAQGTYNMKKLATLPYQVRENHVQIFFSVYCKLLLLFSSGRPIEFRRNIFGRLCHSILILCQCNSQLIKKNLLQFFSKTCSFQRFLIL